MEGGEDSTHATPKELQAMARPPGTRARWQPIHVFAQPALHPERPLPTQDPANVVQCGSWRLRERLSAIPKNCGAPTLRDESLP